ncbi:MAG TPA: hypothetical protein VH280_09580 [Verrucomicrobiae bacterium]|nr:hypothetical protein [Verrucomicrobiae bacterium]
MNDEHKAFSWMMALGCWVFGISILFAILSSRCLYADGAYEFIRVLQSQNFVVLLWSRHFVFYIFEAPLVLAIKLGVTNLSWLRLAFGLGCFLPWPLALAACYWICRKHFWLAATGCAAGYLNAAFVAIAEHIVTHALFWPSLFVILFARPLKPGAIVILLACASAMLFSYESQLFLSAPLSLLALWRAHVERQENNRTGWTIFLIASALFAAGVSVGLCGVLMPEHHADFSAFKNGSRAMLAHLGWPLGWTVGWIVLAVAASFSENIWKLVSQKPGVFVLIAAVLVWGSWPILAPNRGDTGLQYDHRSVDTLVPLALLPLALILRFRPQWLESKSYRLESLAAALLIGQSLWQISATVHWCQDVMWMRETLASHGGIVPLHSTVLAADGMEGRDLHSDRLGGRFDWTWPSLSLALAPKPNIQSFVCSEVFLSPQIRARFWQPYDPLAPQTLPDLRHYGINYRGFLAAMNAPATATK